MEAIIARLDPQLLAPINLSNADVADLVTDPNSVDLSDTIPLRVPSGLPVGP